MSTVRAVEQGKSEADVEAWQRSIPIQVGIGILVDLVGCLPAAVVIIDTSDPYSWRALTKVEGRPGYRDTSTIRRGILNRSPLTSFINDSARYPRLRMRTGRFPFMVAPNLSPSRKCSRIAGRLAGAIRASVIGFYRSRDVTK